MLQFVKILLKESNTLFVYVKVNQIHIKFYFTSKLKATTDKVAIILLLGHIISNVSKRYLIHIIYDLLYYIRAKI